MRPTPRVVHPETIAVLGAGTWGCTLAALLARHGHAVTLWDPDARVVESLGRVRVPAKLPHLHLAPNIGVTGDLAQAVEAASVLVLAAPSVGMRATVEALARMQTDDDRCLYVICTKGLERHTDLTMSQVVLAVLGEGVRERVGVLSGPSHAEEVSAQMPTTVTAAAYCAETARRIQAIFFDPMFRVYTHDDVLGVELGAAVKNVIAIAAGICDGLGMGDNAKAALLTRGLAEMMRLGRALHVNPRTLSGLSGMGDLIVTAISRHSRNRNFGELLAQGLTPEQASEAIGMVVEGAPTARAVCELARRHRVDMPISEAVYSILYESKPLLQAVSELLERDPKSEMD